MPQSNEIISLFLQGETHLFSDIKFIEQHNAQITVNSFIVGRATFFFKAIFIETNEKVFIKVGEILEDHFNEFENECVALNTFDHPNIIKLIYSYEKNVFINGQEKKYGISVFPFAEGGDLFELFIVKKIEMTNRQWLHLIYVLLSAILEIHSKGFIYSDFKLENIVYMQEVLEYTKNGINPELVQLIDFNSVYNSNTSNSYSQEIRRTLPYEAPEIFFYDIINDKNDIYSLGAVMFFCIGKEWIFDFISGCSEDSINYILSKENMENLFGGPEWENISLSIKELIMDMITFDVNKRPTAKELLKLEIFDEFRTFMINEVEDGDFIYENCT